MYKYQYLTSLIYAWLLLTVLEPYSVKRSDVIGNLFERPLGETNVIYAPHTLLYLIAR